MVPGGLNGPGPTAVRAAMDPLYVVKGLASSTRYGDEIAGMSNISPVSITLILIV